MKEKEIRIPCSCTAHELGIYFDQEEKDLVELAFWQYGHQPKYSFLTKLRDIWYTIYYGHPFADMIILDKEGIKTLNKTLEKILSDMK